MPEFDRWCISGPNDSPEQVRYRIPNLAQSETDFRQTARNRALADIAFPDGNAPKYGTAMMRPQYCGKWAVSG